MTMLSARRHQSAAFAAGCLLIAGTAHAAAPTYQVVDHVAGADGGWDFANVASTRGTLYVARTNAVMAMDIATHKVTDALAPAQGSHQALPIDDDKTVVQTDGKTGLTRFIDAVSGRIIANVPSGDKPDAAFFDAATGKVVVMSPGNDTITSIDARTHKVVATMKLAGGLEFAVTNGKGGAFINLEDAARIAEVDLAKGRLLRKIDLPGCEGPTGLARFAHGTRLISACANGVALVVDTASGKTLNTLPIGKDADAVLLDEARGMAFVPCGGSGTLVALSIADANNVTVAQVIPTDRRQDRCRRSARRAHLPSHRHAGHARTRREARQAAARHLHHPHRRAQGLSRSSKGFLHEAFCFRRAGLPRLPVLAQPACAAEARHLQYLDARHFVPSQILPAPAARGSAEEAFELETLHRLLAKASPERLKQAKVDNDNEDPSLFNNVLGFDLKTKPATWALLTLVQSEADVAAGDSKAFFHRMRPYSVDPSIPFCEHKPDPAKPEYKSYPSGHTTLGYSVGWVLAHLMPQKADIIMARARIMA
jgi:hypothetical protein